MVVNTDPLVSIITPVCNGSAYLVELIESIRNQDYPKIEHIIIDDGSQDSGATVAVLQRYPHLRWWSHANKGQYATMNDGFSAAKGDLVCFVSADDIVSPGAVSAVVEFLIEHPSCDGVFGLTGRINSQGKPTPYYIPFQTSAISFYPYFAHISHCSLYIKKDLLNQHDLVFDGSLRYVGDYDWMIRIYKAGLKIGFVRRELSRVRLHAYQTSQRYSAGSRLETQKVIERHQINKVSFGFLNRLYRFVFKAWYLMQAIKKGELTMLVLGQFNRYNHK